MARSSLGPVPAFGVEHEPVEIRVRASRPAEVDAPDRRRLPVAQSQQLGAVRPYNATRGLARLPVVLAELHGGPNLVALALAFLLVGGDPIAAPRGDVLQAQQIAQRLLERAAAALAYVRPVADGDRMEVAADAAQLRPLGGKALSVRVGVDGEDHLVDEISSALVIDHAARAELGDGQEARALYEVFGLASRPSATTGDERGQRQPREAVAGQESLAGEIAIAVEVA